MGGDGYICTIIYYGEKDGRGDYIVYYGEKDERSAHYYGKKGLVQKFEFSLYCLPRAACSLTSHI